MKLEEFFVFGKNEPINRLAYTEQDAIYKMLIMKKMQDLNMKIQMDECGNICGVYEKGVGPTIVMGSHTDSVPNGGQYDGPAGVISALMAVQKATQTSKINGKVIVAIYACEESSRFKQACIGSRYLSGELTKEDFLRIEDPKGTLLIEAIADFREYIEKNKEEFEIGEIQYVNKIFNPEKVTEALEMHIEQYETLYKSKKQIGIVNSIVAPLRGTLEVFGKTGHSGATPMNERHDAVRTASQFMEELNKLSEKTNSFRVTFPKFETGNWSANIIQDRVTLFMDIRQQAPLKEKETLDIIYQELKKTASKSKVDFEFKATSCENPVKTNEAINRRLQQVCEDRGIKYVVMPSWAGHDTAHLKNSTLIFIPSTGGSHNRNENTTKEDIEVGIELYSEYIKGRLKEKKRIVDLVEIDYSSINKNNQKAKLQEKRIEDR